MYIYNIYIYILCIYYVYTVSVYIDHEKNGVIFDGYQALHPNLHEESEELSCNSLHRNVRCNW